MSFTVNITTQDTRANGKVRIWYSLTNDATGKVYPNRGPVSVPANDIPARMQAWADKFENGLESQELQWALSQVQKGADVETIPLDKVPRVRVRRRALKAVINDMRAASSNRERYEALVQASPLFASYTNIQISNLVGLTAQEVAGIRVKLDAFNAAAADIDHGHGEIE